MSRGGRIGYFLVLALVDIHEDNDKHAEQLIIKASKAIENVWDSILSLVTSSITLCTDFVQASRHVPSTIDLTFCLGSPSALSSLPISVSAISGATEYKRLASSISSLKTENHYIKHCEPKDFSATVNHYLIDHLFTEKGYRLDHTKFYLIPDDKATNGAINEESTASIVTIFLRDQNGVKLDFINVGSGIGYVLPVLVSVVNNDGFSLIQQPELHLHPALQAAMADVFIEGSSTEKRVIVETHSEHLLLRLLRRIRQTSGAQPPSTELRLTPEDVSVLYFDPQLDGTTKVKRLRISEDGEFLDRWPRGFFGERDKELFDE